MAIHERMEGEGEGEGGGREARSPRAGNRYSLIIGSAAAAAAAFGRPNTRLKLRPIIGIGARSRGPMRERSAARTRL